MPYPQSIDMNKIQPLQCDTFNNVTLLPMVGDITSYTQTYALGAFADKKPLHHVRRMIQKDAHFYHLPYVEPWYFSPQEVIYGGIFFMHWGHFLLENLQRLWYAKEKNLPIVWTGVNGFTYTPGQFKSWQEEIFHALGIENTHIFLTEPTQFAKVHFPQPGSGINTHLHPQQVDFLGYHEEKVIKGKYVYFSRAKTRSCSNEEHIEKILTRRGWHIIYPEELTVKEQLHAMSTAQVCFMIGGSAQHTMLFTKNLQSRFIVIPREHTESFNLIAHSKSDDYFLFYLPKSVQFSDQYDEANDVFTLDISILENTLEQTNDFTQNLQNFPQLFSRPEPLEEKHLTVPVWYTDPLPTLSDEKAAHYQAYFLYEQKKYRDAYTIFQHLQKRNVLDENMQLDFFHAAQQCHLQHNANIALPLEKHCYYKKLYKRNIDKNSQVTRNYKKLTDLYLIEGNIQAAIALQEELYEKNPHWSKPLARIASIYTMTQQWKKALEYAQKAVEIEPHKLQHVAELARCLIHNKEYEACKKLLGQTLHKHPTWNEGYLQLATVHSAQGALDKAIACVEKSLHMVPDNFIAKEQLATYLRLKGKHSDAVTLLAQALQQNPRQAEKHAQNARVYAHNGDYAKAVEHARQAVALEPRNYICKAHLATYLTKNKQYEEVLQLMQDAVHKNPFWSEPHAQFAAIEDALGNTKKAIYHARRAVAVEPYDRVRKNELEAYRIKELSAQIPPEHLEYVLHKRLTPSRIRIQSYIDILNAQSYLEVGVFRGRTFLYLDVPFKIGVDPNFQFNVQDFAHENCLLCEKTSDDFFEKFPELAANLHHAYQNKDFKFDVIFLDGLHTYEQTLKDFENTLPYSHEKTLWIIDDTVPSNYFSAMNSQSRSQELRTCAGLSQEPAWHGDVFKAIFAIHDKYPEFSYCTQVNNGNPQTIVWRTQTPTKRKPVFTTTQAIEHMRYEDFIEYAWVMHPVIDAQVLGKIFTNINPLDYKTGKEHSLIISPLITDKEKEYAHKNKELQDYIAQLSQEKELSTNEILLLKDKITHLMQENVILQKENAILKKHL